MLSHHLLDSLSIASMLAGCRKGGCSMSAAAPGLPGIPLAIAMPDTIWTCSTATRKKTRFIQQAVAHCGIDNAQVVHAGFRTIMRRTCARISSSAAPMPVAEFCDSVAHLLAPGTRC